MHIGVIGTGYVGLVTGACLAEFGVFVTCVDKDASRIDQLKKGIIPFFEPGLDALVNKNLQIDIASNPEFLREGSAIEDFMRPNRVVIGGESPEAIKIMKDLYRPLYLIETPFVITSIERAELIKYASNSFLAVKISFINEIANPCEKVGADVHMVAKGMGLDQRIPGPGYGGSCLPKDTLALLKLAEEHGEDRYFFDLRNIYEPKKMKKMGFIYHSVGRS